MAITAAQPLHQLYELFAKGIYGYFGGNKAAVVEQLKIAGYSIDKEFNDPNTSFQALGLIYQDGTRHLYSYLKVQPMPKMPLMMLTRKESVSINLQLIKILSKIG